MRYHDDMDQPARANPQPSAGRDAEGTPQADPDPRSGNDRHAGADVDAGTEWNADRGLERVFERSLYDVSLPNGTVTLLVRRAPLGNSGPIRDRRLAIVTAYNPG